MCVLYLNLISCDFKQLLNTFVLIKNILQQRNEVAPLVIQVVMCTPPIVGIIYVIVKFLLSVCESNTSRIKTALKGTKTNMVKELGFMHKVKYEVRFKYKIQSKVF